LKELWVEIPENAQPDEREDLFTTANEACATILEGKTATNQMENAR